jgi:hypothetical protein
MYRRSGGLPLWLPARAPDGDAQPRRSAHAEPGHTHDESGAVRWTVEPADLATTSAGWSSTGAHPQHLDQRYPDRRRPGSGCAQLRIAHPDYEVWTGSATGGRRADGATDSRSYPQTREAHPIEQSRRGPVTISGGQWNENRLAKVTPLVASVPPGSNTLRVYARRLPARRTAGNTGRHASEQFSLTLEKSKGPATGHPGRYRTADTAAVDRARGLFDGRGRIAAPGDADARYWLGRYEVTQGSGSRMGNNPSNFKSGGRNAPGRW